MPVFTANIPTVLKIGDRIEIGGKIKENARKMSVNLCAQEGEEPRDVVLHFDVRFHRDNIISLSRKNGVWIGSGNYDTNYNMFVPGTAFRIIFEIKDTDVITIYCQGKFHSNFLPKIPLVMARYIVAWADVERVTHCYFHVNNKAVSGDEAPAASAPPPFVPPPCPRSPMVAGDVKRSSRQYKKGQGPESHAHTSDSSEEETHPDGRADRYFYDALMCAPDRATFPQDTRRREQSAGRNKMNYKYHEDTDTDKNESEGYSEELASKNMDSSLAESDDVLQELGMKKRGRRGRMSPFAQVVNFMGKSGKRN